MLTAHHAAGTLPDSWHKHIETQLQADEGVVAWFETDLNAELRYESSLVVLTTQRILSVHSALAGSNGRADEHSAERQSWNLSGDMTLQSKDYATAGALVLSTSDRRLAVWRYTSGRTAAAHRFLQRFTALQTGHSGAAVTPAVCPSCGGLIDPTTGECPQCEVQPAPPPTSSLLRLVQFARPRAGMVLFGFVLTVLGTAASLVPPYLTIPLIDQVLIPYSNNQPYDTELVYWLLGGLAVAALIAWVLDWAKTYVLAWVSERISADMRSRTYRHLQELSLEFFGGKRTGDLMSRVGSDSDRICNFLSLNLVDFAADVLMITMTSIILILIEWKLALVALIPFPFIVFLVHWVRQRLRRGFRQSGVAWADMTSVLADTIPGIRVVKAFAQEDREVERFERTNVRVLATNDRVNVVWSFFGPLVTLLTELGLWTIYAFGAYLVFQDAIKLGVLVGFIAYIGRFYTKIDSLIRMVTAVQRAAASAHRIFEILDKQPSVAEPVNPVYPGRIHGRIELSDVRFKYGTREVLHGLNLAIKPGEMVGLVGQSGAGKSTLINLICRFYDVADGAILVDGHDVRSFPIEEYRRNIGIVLQDPFLFYGTITENIAYGRPTATRAEIVAAARAAGAHEFILRLPDGYDSLVGERGQSLSGGERQRISIARALLIDPRILILDEATSSVDTETEREIQRALERLIQGRTTIAIAHRLSTLRRADRLVVMQRGQIVEIGKHEELLAQGGAYARLHQVQMEMAQEIGI
ncbi:MAG: ABC transporter transmembrane domain-containing protein [Pirellulales bacterium]